VNGSRFAHDNFAPWVLQRPQTPLKELYSDRKFSKATTPNHEVARALLLRSMISRRLRSLSGKGKMEQGVKDCPQPLAAPPMTLRRRNLLPMTLPRCSTNVSTSPQHSKPLFRNTIKRTPLKIIKYRMPLKRYSLGALSPSLRRMTSRRPQSPRA
jgi:hypothetical protein